MESRNKIHNLILLSLMLAAAITIHRFEAMLPSLIFIAPGIKLGLSNIVTVVMLFHFRFREIALVIFVKCLIASLLGAGLTTFFYSIAGGFLSLLGMFLLLKFDLKFSVFGVSIFGSVLFNIGQLLVASLMIGSFAIFVYLPFMGIASLATGFFVGLVSNYLLSNKNFTSLLNNKSD